jgi:hypothetical protein
VFFVQSFLADTPGALCQDRRGVFVSTHSCRADYQYKLIRTPVLEHRLLVIEDLHIKVMERNQRLAKQIADAGLQGQVVWL